MVLWQLWSFPSNSYFKFMLWFAQQVDKYLDDPVESYCKSVDTDDFYIPSGQMDLTYSLHCWHCVQLFRAYFSCLDTGVSPHFALWTLSKSRGWYKARGEEWWRERSLPGLCCSTKVPITTRLFRCPGTVSGIDLITWADTKCYNKSYNQGTDSQHYQTATGASPAVSCKKKNRQAKISPRWLLSLFFVF